MNFLLRRVPRYIFSTNNSNPVENIKPPPAPKLFDGELENFRFDIENARIFDGYNMDELYGSKIGLKHSPALLAEMRKYISLYAEIQSHAFYFSDWEFVWLPISPTSKFRDTKNWWSWMKGGAQGRSLSHLDKRIFLLLLLSILKRNTDLINKYAHKTSISKHSYHITPYHIILYSSLFGNVKEDWKTSPVEYSSIISHSLPCRWWLTIESRVLSKLRHSSGRSYLQWDGAKFQESFAGKSVAGTLWF